jgi:hypothetical protein
MIFTISSDGQLEGFVNIKDLKENEEYVVTDILHSNNLYPETIKRKKYHVNTICDMNGEPIPSIKSNYFLSNKNDEHLSYVKVQKGHYLIFLRRYTDEKQDPYVFIFEVKDIIDNTLLVRLERKQRYGERFRRSLGKFHKVVEFAVKEQLDSPNPKQYSVDDKNEFETCLFISEGDRLVSFNKNGRELVLDPNSDIMRFYKHYGSLPSMLIINCIYPKRTRAKIIKCDGFVLNHVTKNDWFNNISKIEKTFGILSDLNYVTTINGYTFMAFCRGNKIYPLIKKGNEFDVVEINKYQREKLTTKISQAYFNYLNIIGTVLV